jgi:hypothetical protein
MVSFKDNNNTESIDFAEQFGKNKVEGAFKSFVAAASSR